MSLDFPDALTRDSNASRAEQHRADVSSIVMGRGGRKGVDEQPGGQSFVCGQVVAAVDSHAHRSNHPAAATRPARRPHPRVRARRM